ncbi:hypothetical protein GR170_05850 [Pseudooceanicola sp. GBMRC 2024]|uniref:Uncharacterized protein n=1 Tax=Pseudooceanicola albus TaxID=2692189 RepID=A0A6L7G1I5_9RHOB|nr:MULTISPECIES: hypothetical protein [Pseudooceanicola]MXN17350.1 hypothetical protein [Pseudooceanicola albus]
MGDRYLRQLVFVEMTSHVRQLTTHPERADPWLTKLLQGKPARLATASEKVHEINYDLPCGSLPHRTLAGLGPLWCSFPKPAIGGVVQHGPTAQGQPRGRSEHAERIQIRCIIARRSVFLLPRICE